MQLKFKTKAELVRKDKNNNLSKPTLSKKILCQKISIKNLW